MVLTAQVLSADALDSQCKSKLTEDRGHYLKRADIPHHH